MLEAFYKRENLLLKLGGKFGGDGMEYGLWVLKKRVGKGLRLC